MSFLRVELDGVPSLTLRLLGGGSLGVPISSCPFVFGGASSSSGISNVAC